MAARSRSAEVHGNRRWRRGGVGAQTWGAARDLVMYRGYCEQGVAVDAMLAGNRSWFVGSVGVGVVGPQVGRRRAQKIEGKGSGGSIQ